MQLMINDMPIWLASKSVDFRKSIEGLCQIVIDDLSCQPGRGVFIFYNRERNRLKLLCWHVNGFILIYKKFEKGKLTLCDRAEGKVNLNTEQLQWLLLGVDWVTLSSDGSCPIEYFC